MDFKKKKKEAPNDKETSSGMEHVDNIIYKYYYKYKNFSITEKILTVVGLIYLFFWSASLLRGYLL